MKLKWSNIKSVGSYNWDKAVEEAKNYSEEPDKSDKGSWRLPTMNELQEYGSTLDYKNLAVWTSNEGLSCAVICYLEDGSVSDMFKENLMSTIFVREIEETVREPFWEIRDCLQVQEKSALLDDYNLGLYNGIEFCLAILEKREPKYKDMEIKKPKIPRYRIDVLQNSGKEITGMKYELEEDGNWIQYNDIRNLIDKHEYLLFELKKLLRDVK